MNIRSDRDSLGIAFSKMVSNLRSLIANVKEQSEIVSQSAKVLSDMADQFAQAITSAITQNLQTAAAAATDAHNTSVMGEKSLKTLVDKIMMIKSVSEASAAAMNKLSDKSSQIGEIVGMITKFADQSSLLSLNANIEAARAGEAGRGFAVVAGEVRKLAENSSNSAQEISSIVEEVRGDTKEVSASFINGQQHINIGASLTKESSRKFREIVAKLDNISGQIEKMAAASEEISASSQETTSAAAQLSGTAKVLRDAVNKFVV